MKRHLRWVPDGVLHLNRLVIDNGLLHGHQCVMYLSGLRGPLSMTQSLSRHRSVHGDLLRRVVDNHLLRRLSQRQASNRAGGPIIEGQRVPSGSRVLSSRGLLVVADGRTRDHSWGHRPIRRKSRSSVDATMSFKLSVLKNSDYSGYVSSKACVTIIWQLNDENVHQSVREYESKNKPKRRSSGNEC